MGAILELHQWLKPHVSNGNSPDAVYEMTVMLNTAKSCWRASAATQVSFAGIGRPDFSILAEWRHRNQAVAESTASTSVNGRVRANHSSLRSQ